MSSPDPTARGATRRLFFALWPDAATRQALVHATRKAVRHCGGRPVPPGNLHATIAFLGPVPEDRLTAVFAAGEAAAAPGGPLPIRVDGIEVWPKPRVLVATAPTPAAAVELAERLWEGVEPLGIARDPRPLRIHVTLARKVGKPPPAPGLHPVDWTVGDLALVESVTDPAGARYTPVARWPLGPAPAGVTP